MLAGVVVAGCGGASAQAAPRCDVFAAASLTEAFKALGAHSRLDLRLNFAGSSTLVTQILQGAPADVFASADQPNLQKLVDAGLAAGQPAVFARNRLEIVVRPGNPKRIGGLADLARGDVIYIAAAPEVPAGRYAAQALARAGVKATPRSLEADVKGVVGKVALGEADAGIVYVTDVRGAGPSVAGVAIPDAQNVVATYPAVAVKGAAHPDAAAAFIRLLLSEEGQKVLGDFGFEHP